MMVLLNPIDGKPLETGNAPRSLIASGGSAVLHGAIIVCLLAASYSHVETLAEPSANSPMVWIMPAPQAAAAAAPAPHGPSQPNAETAREPVTVPARIPDIVDPQEASAETPPENGGGDQGVEGRTEGGIDGGIPGGIHGGVAGGIIGSVDGGVAGGVAGGVLDGLPGADQPIYLTGEVRPPERTLFAKPEYPEVARKARAEGKVVLEIVVDTTGNVEDVRVLRSDPLFDRAAVEAVRTWRYRPALQSGRPVKVYLTVVVDFQLTGR